MDNYFVMRCYLNCQSFKSCLSTFSDNGAGVAVVVGVVRVADDVLLCVVSFWVVLRWW